MIKEGEHEMFLKLDIHDQAAAQSSIEGWPLILPAVTARPTIDNMDEVDANEDEGISQQP
jgi:hypothetical protein